MTVIVTDGKGMAADGLTCCGNLVVQTNSVKVHRLNDGTLYGSSGVCDLDYAYMNFLNHGGEMPDLGDNFDALTLKPDGRVFWHSRRGVQVEFSPPYAIGSGQDVALAAMKMGASLEKAVQVAKDLITTCGGITTVEYLK